MSTSDERPASRGADPHSARRTAAPRPKDAGVDDREVAEWIASASVKCPYCNKSIELKQKEEQDLRVKLASRDYADAKCNSCGKLMRITLNFAKQFHAEKIGGPSSPASSSSSSATTGTAKPRGGAGKPGPASAPPPLEKSRGPARLSHPGDSAQTTEKKQPTEKKSSPSLSYEQQSAAGELDAPARSARPSDNGEAAARARETVADELEAVVEQVRQLTTESEQKTRMLLDAFQKQIESLTELSKSFREVNSDVKGLGKARLAIVNEINEGTLGLSQINKNLKVLSAGFSAQVENLSQAISSAKPKSEGAKEAPSAPVVSREEQLLLQLRRKFFSPDFAELLKSYQEWLSQQAAAEMWLEAAPRTPELLDIVDFELREWRQSDKEDVPEGERKRVIEVLEKIQKRQDAWRQSVRLVRFPQEGEPFDQYKHVLERTRPTSDPNQYNTVCEVVRSGYVFRDATTPLREARVVVYIPEEEGHA